MAKGFKGDDAHNREMKFLGTEKLRGGLVFNAHRLLYHSTLGLRVMKKKCEELKRAGRIDRNRRFQIRWPRLLMNEAPLYWIP
jgi:hypothetical protein